MTVVHRRSQQPRIESHLILMKSEWIQALVMGEGSSEFVVQSVELDNEGGERDVGRGFLSFEFWVQSVEFDNAAQGSKIQKLSTQHSALRTQNFSQSPQ